MFALYVRCIYIYNVCMNCYKDIVLRWWVQHIERCCSVGWIWNNTLPFVSPNGPQPILRNFNWKSNCTYVSHHGILVNSSEWLRNSSGFTIARTAIMIFLRPTFTGRLALHAWLGISWGEGVHIATLNDVQPLWG